MPRKFPISALVHNFPALIRNVAAYLSDFGKSGIPFSRFSAFELKQCFGPLAAPFL